MLFSALPAMAAPSFPALTGRVVDDAHILSEQTKSDLDQKLAPADVADQHEHPRRAGNPLAQARLNRRGQRRIAQIDLEQAASAQCWVGQPRLAQRAVQVGQRIVQLRARALA